MASSGQRIRVTDIAAEAGVSVATVSKVLNGRLDVAPATRARIEGMLIARQYVPTKRTRRPSVRPASVRRGSLIEILFNDAGTPWAAEMISGAEQAARGAGVGIVVSVLEGGPGGGRQWVGEVAGRGSRGVILALSDLPASDLKRIVKLGVPVVLVDPVGDLDADLPSIGAGNWGGGMAATRHLLDLGHCRIGTITGPMRYLCSQARLAGYRAALERAGIDPDPDLVQRGDFYHDSALRSALRLLDLPEPPTAIVTGNDEQALGVYAAVRQRGLRVPEDLSVVGFDDVPMAQWISPPLTTVHQPIRELAELATRAVLHATGGVAELTQGRVELSTTLVVRGSTAALSR
ncbi:MAG TPA: LacI family DNA-binding transcriptional regulator [Rugosimonospora sp.]